MPPKKAAQKSPATSTKRPRDVESVSDDGLDDSKPLAKKGGGGGGGGSGLVGGAGGGDGGQPHINYVPMAQPVCMKRRFQCHATSNLDYIIPLIARQFKNDHRYELTMMQALCILLGGDHEAMIRTLKKSANYQVENPHIGTDYTRVEYEEGVCMIHQTLNYSASGGSLDIAEKRLRACTAILNNDALRFTITEYPHLKPIQMSISTQFISSLDILSNVASKLVNETSISRYTSIMPQNSNFVGFMQKSKMEVFKYASEGINVIRFAESKGIACPGGVEVDYLRIASDIAIMECTSSEKIAYMGHCRVKPTWYTNIMGLGPLCCIGVHKLQFTELNFREGAGAFSYANVSNALLTDIVTYVQKTLGHPSPTSGLEENEALFF